MLMSAALTLAAIHLFIWRKQPRQWAHLAFSTAAVAAAVLTFMEYMAMHALTVERMSLLLRWAHLPLLVFWLAIVYFVRYYFDAGRPALARMACGLRALALLLSFTTGQNLFFKEVTGLKHVVIFGGETISIAQGVLNPWYVVGPLSALALAAFVLDASIALWRRGTESDRRRAVLFSGGIIFFLVTAVGHGILVNAGLVNSPYIVGFSFMPTVVAMSYELSHEVLRAAQTAQQLAASEAALRKSEQRMRLAADAADLGLWEWDIERDEIWSTGKSRALFGIAPEERIDFERFLDTLHDEDREAVRRAVEKALAGGNYESEYRIVPPDGNMHWFAARGRVEADGGKPLRMLGVVLDISRRKQAELEAQQRRDELTHLSRVTLLGELSGALAHELNQPLAAILSNAQAAQRFLAQGASGLSEVRDILGDIVDADKRAGEVIQRLRLLLKKGEMQRQPLAVNDVVQEVLKLLHGDLLNQHIAVGVELAPQLPAVLGDRVQLQQVLLNLLLNGCEAMARGAADGRRLHVRSAWTQDAVEVSVCDRGPGIPPEHIESIFEPFFTTKVHGIGLGLAVCRTIISAHGGRLWAVNNAAGGAGFYVALPAYADAAPLP
jgi:PAS domain S-box-containing protein